MSKHNGRSNTPRLCLLIDGQHALSPVFLSDLNPIPGTAPCQLPPQTRPAFHCMRIAIAQVAFSVLPPWPIVVSSPRIAPPSPRVTLARTEKFFLRASLGPIACGPPSRMPVQKTTKPSLSSHRDVPSAEATRIALQRTPFSPPIAPATSWTICPLSTAGGDHCSTDLPHLRHPLRQSTGKAATVSVQ